VIVSEIARVSITIPASVVAEIGRFEKNRSAFILEAVRRELRRRQMEELRRSLAHPHPESQALVEEGFAEWATGLPDEDAESLVDPKAGRDVRWIPGQGWIEKKR
jgi:hypothetical protein